MRVRLFSFATPTFSLFSSRGLEPGIRNKFDQREHLRQNKKLVYEPQNRRLRWQTAFEVSFTLHSVDSYSVQNFIENSLQSSQQGTQVIRREWSGSLLDMSAE